MSFDYPTLISGTLHVFVERHGNNITVKDVKYYEHLGQNYTNLFRKFIGKTFSSELNLSLDMQAFFWDSCVSDALDYYPEIDIKIQVREAKPSVG